VERVVRRAVAAVDADRGTVCRLEDDRFVVEAEWSSPGTAPMAPGCADLIADLPELRAALRTGRPTMLTRERMSPAAAELVRRTGSRHWIVCPLVVAGQAVGTLGLSRRRDRPFARADLETLVTFATLAALLVPRTAPAPGRR